jgi:hypothetical protein
LNPKPYRDFEAIDEYPILKSSGIQPRMREGSYFSALFMQHAGKLNRLLYEIYYLFLITLVNSKNY